MALKKYQQNKSVKCKRSQLIFNFPLPPNFMNQKKKIQHWFTENKKYMEQLKKKSDLMAG